MESHWIWRFKFLSLNSKKRWLKEKMVSFTPFYFSFLSPYLVYFCFSLTICKFGFSRAIASLSKWPSHFMFLPIMFLCNCNFFYNNIPKGALSLDFSFLLPICKHNCWGTRKLYFYFYFLFFNFDSIIFFHFLFLFKLTLIQTLLNLLTKSTT